MAIREAIQAFEDRFPRLSVGVGCFVYLILAGIAFGILEYVAHQLNGAVLVFLLLLAFLGGFVACDKFAESESGRRHYEETWKRRDEIFKKTNSN